MRASWFAAPISSYIGPQIEALLGWMPDSWMTVTDWAEPIHAGERQKTVDCCGAQSLADADHTADYRALTKGGEHVWIRDVVHVVHKLDGSVAALVGFMFDITARKAAEDNILQLQREPPMGVRSDIASCRWGSGLTSRHGLSFKRVIASQKPW